VIALSKYGSAQSDFRREVDRILAAAKTEVVLLRVIGALAFNMHCPKYGYLQEMLGRAYTDIDFASYTKHGEGISKLFANLGYEEDFMVSRLFGRSRLLFHDNSDNKRHCDVFFDKLEFCHDIPFKDRLEVDELTIPLAELILEKMQIVKINQKDLIDTVMLLREHEIGRTDSETINGQRIAQLCAAEWGLWRTATMNLGRVGEYVSNADKLDEEDKQNVQSKIEQLLKLIEEEPKSTGWRLRARIGDKRKWYRDVEELSR
jgi:hypothetical protein